MIKTLRAGKAVCSETRDKLMTALLAKKGKI